MLEAKYSALEKRVCEFVDFASDQGLPVSKSSIQERASMNVEEMNLIPFSASNGWFEKFLVRNNIQPSLRLDGRGDSSLPIMNAEIMQDIRQEAVKFQLKHI